MTSATRLALCFNLVVNSETRPGRLASIKKERGPPSGQLTSPSPVGKKFKVASEDSFDRGAFVLAGFLAGEAQLTNANRPFGQAAEGFGGYYGSATLWARSFGDIATPEQRSS